MTDAPRSTANLRPAKPEDVPALLHFVRELAAFEREADAVKMTEAQLRDALFGQPRRAEALLAEQDSKPVGMAMWFETFNTWTGRPAIYLEDIYIDPEFRGHGLGRRIFRYLAKLAVGRGCQRFEWSVLSWNARGIAFYERMGAKAQSDWTKYRLSEDALTRLGLSPEG